MRGWDAGGGGGLNEGARRCAWVPASLLVLVSSLLLAGCTRSREDCGDPHDSPCPWPFDLGGWCYTSGRCELDSGGLFVGELQRGDTARIPVGELADEMGVRHAVQFNYSWPVPDPAPEPLNVIMTLDGLLGSVRQSSVAIEGVVFVRWEPHLPSPQLIEVRFEDGGDDRPANLDLLLEDANCEETHPRPVPCPQ